jgi:type I restriction enzyme S subunit
VELTSVLLSIKPKYVKAILDGQKQYEFRKVIFKNPNINKIFIYSTYPVKKVVGTFNIREIIEGHPIELWNNFKLFSGLNENEFFSYFNGNSHGYAIKIDNPREFESPMDLTDIHSDLIPPQSFCYLRG